MKRFYVRVSKFSLGKVLMALLDDDNVSEVCVSLEDNDLLVSFSERPKRQPTTETGQVRLNK